MEIAAVALQAISAQQQIAVQVLKQASEAQAALATMIAQSASVGRNLDISV